MEKLYHGFEQYYGNTENSKLFFSPGRVNLIGEHTDYNGGHVFPCALTMGTYALVKEREDRLLNFVSLNFENQEVVSISLDEIEYKKKNGWANYLIGVVFEFQKRGFKLDKGFNLAMYGNIPAGAGLSSSASIEVLMGVILKDLYKIDINKIDIAKIGQISENEFNGMNCGIMDQFAVAMGKRDNAIFLDTSTLEYEYAKISLTDAKIIITNSNVKHSLVNSAYNDRRRECEKALSILQTKLNINSLGELTSDEFEKNKYLLKDEIILKRAKHAVYENERTLKAVEALKNNDIVEFGKLMNESHLSLRDDYDVSCAEIDILVDIAWSIDGVYGSRITGGGFGGSTVSIIKNEAVEIYKERVAKEYSSKTGIEAQVYEAKIGDGAGILDESPNT